MAWLDYRDGEIVGRIRTRSFSASSARSPPGSTPVAAASHSSSD